MLEAVLKGVLAGLAYGMLLGPLFFMSMQVTLKSGLRNGLALALGAFLSDALLALGGIWSSARLMAIAQQNMFQTGMGLLGSVLIMGFGISAVLPRKRDLLPGSYGNPAKRRYSFIKGFALNMANPSNWLFWLGLAAAARAEAPAGNDAYTGVFMLSSVAMVFSTDMAKVLLAGEINRRLHPDLPGRIVRVAGFILIAVGLWVLVKSLQFNA